MEQDLASTGIEGLDDVLRGGFVRNRMYLVQGHPGCGKTTLGLQFLLAGAANGERGLYITLSESRNEITAIAASHGWSLEPLVICELKPHDSAVPSAGEYTMYHPSEVELHDSLQMLLDEFIRVKPTRVVIDSLSGNSFARPAASALSAAIADAEALLCRQGSDRAAPRR